MGGREGGKGRENVVRLDVTFTAITSHIHKPTAAEEWETLTTEIFA